MGGLKDLDIRSRLGEIAFFLQGSPGPDKEVMDLHHVFNEEKDEVRLLDDLKRVMWKVEEYLNSPGSRLSHSDSEVRRVWVSVLDIRNRIEHNLC